MRQNTKDLILQSAIDLFSIKGFNASTTAEIAQRAGVAEVTVFRHYKTKKDILMAVLAQFIDVFGQEVILNPISDILDKNGGKSRKEILTMMVKDRISVIEKNSDIIWIILTEMKYHADLQEKIAEGIGADAIALMNKALQENLGDGVTPKHDTEAVMRAFMGVVLSIVLHYKVLSGILPIAKTIDESIDEAVEILLYGISNE